MYIKLLMKALLKWSMHLILVKMLSVGDMKNNLRVLKSEARQMKYSEDFDLDG